MKKVKFVDRDKNEGEISVDKLIFRPSVYGVLIEDGKILLSKQWDGYDFPGGGVDLGETIDEALEREFWEETGLKVKRKEVVCCESNFFYAQTSKEYFHSILIYYLCEKVGGELSMDNFDEYEKEYADMPEWIDLKDVDKLKFYNSIDSLDVLDKAIKVINRRK